MPKCVTCKSESYNVVAPCRCCQLVNGDSTPKKVFYCRVCKVYLCSDCETRYLKRILAAGINSLRNLLP